MIRIYTDGGCSENPGPGGWAYIIVLETFQGDKVLTEKLGAEKDTTNNRMELTAVIKSLEALNGMKDLPRKVALYTDSQYVQKGITEWIQKWKLNSWRTSDKKPVKNQDLWQRLEEASLGFYLEWVWIKGHAGNEYNERCDVMTKEAIVSLL